MSSSEIDSESCNTGSPLSQLESPRYHPGSPYSSPSQQVPQLTFSMTELTCTDSRFMKDNGRPYLRILEEPQNHFRFRYKSEMVGTHGCLLGESSATSKTKTHPTVELVNYSGSAIIRCQLAQHKTPDEHPHKLLEEEQDRDVSYEVPEQGSYKIAFAGMGIIHTAKKNVPGLLFKKYSESNPKYNSKDLRLRCENEAKGIDLNIVRLKFSAHDIQTDKEICPPVFSRPIYNMKCAATNDLKICRISRSCGRASGGEDVFLLVEKVNKKNILVRLFELNECGEETWSATGHFLQSDVHHQYAIVFRTPPYKDPHTTEERKVFIELVRPSDGRTSEPKEFVYKASPKMNKKRKASSTYSSLNSSGGSFRSNGDVPATVLLLNQQNNDVHMEEIRDVQMFQLPQIPQIPQQTSNNPSDLGDAILYGMRAEGSPSEPQKYESPMMPQGSSDPPDLQLNSAELERILRDDNSISQEERERFINNDWTEYFDSFSGSLKEENSYSMDIIRAMLVSDSGRGTTTQAGSSKQCEFNVQEEDKKFNIIDKTKGNIEYSAFYTAEHGSEVKKLVKELCEMIRDKTGVKKQIVRVKLERLFELRLSNGDTFLHMTLCSKQPSLDYIVKLIHNMKMTHLLNLTNYHSQTILHLAIIYDMPKKVSFLISKGCNPMIEDSEGNNAVHYAVIYQNCLEPLLEALKTNQTSYNLNAFNNDKQTALHLAVIYKSESSTRLLLQSGASYNARDSEGRTPLHLAVCDDCLPVARSLLDHVLPSEIDALDGRGYTALQVACDGHLRENTLEIVKLLLDKKADPLKREEHTPSAWQLCKEEPRLRELMRARLPQPPPDDDDIKSEPEDDFESADEGESQEYDLSELPLYLDEVSALLDAGEGWRALAERLRLQGLHSWYSNTPSPARTLLCHLKECGGNISSKFLAVIMEEIGQPEAAKVIRRYIE